MTNVELAYITIGLIVLCFVAIGLFIGTIICLFKINKRLEKFNEWNEQYEKDIENEKMKVIKDFEKWYKENNNGKDKTNEN